jgi:cyclopropane fatty-acyl-phospholipid synthase-like methyltransferase
MSGFTGGNFNPVSDRMMRTLLQEAGIREAMQILGAGCGPGCILRFALRYSF